MDYFVVSYCLDGSLCVCVSVVWLVKIEKTGPLQAAGSTPQKKHPYGFQWWRCFRMVILCFIAFSAVHIWWFHFWIAFCLAFFLSFSLSFNCLVGSLSLCLSVQQCVLFKSYSVGRALCVTWQSKRGYGYFHINNVHVFLIALRCEYFCRWIRIQNQLGPELTRKA